MLNFNSFGKVFILIGLLFLGIGTIFLLIKHVPFLGKLPGDILIQKKNFTFYFPLATSILLSIVLSLLFYLFSKK
jgi:hypothetical protein